MQDAPRRAAGKGQQQRLARRTVAAKLALKAGTDVGLC
jgi:hypothetical protein